MARHRSFTPALGQCMQKERQQLLLITSYNGDYQEGYKIPIHSLWHVVEVLPQPSYVTSLCKSAITSGRTNELVHTLYSFRCESFMADRTGLGSTTLHYLAVQQAIVSVFSVCTALLKISASIKTTHNFFCHILLLSANC